MGKVDGKLYRCNYIHVQLNFMRNIKHFHIQKLYTIIAVRFVSCVLSLDSTFFYEKCYLRELFFLHAILSDFIVEDFATEIPINLYL